MSLTDENKKLYLHLKSVFGEEPRLQKYWDDAHENWVGIVTAKDCPDKGAASYATLGVSDHSIDLEVEGDPLRVEFVMAGGMEFEELPNILATCAFNVLNSDFAAMPGVVYPRVVEMYRPKGSMKDILLVSPNLWTLETQTLQTKRVAWLQAVPISQSESRFAKKHGSDALEEIFEKEQIDLYDLNRRSVA